MNNNIDDKINATFPAYPLKIDNISYNGLSKRELLAAMAMQGLLGDREIHGTTKDFAVAAIEYADALLKELER